VNKDVGEDCIFHAIEAVEKLELVGKFCYRVDMLCRVVVWRKRQE